MMVNKVKGFSRYIFLTFAAFVAIQANAQVDTQSPYSFYGIGTMQRNQLQTGMAMGGTFHALRDSITPNYLNPASYSSIDVTQLIFGFEGNIISRANVSDRNIYINQVGLAVPIMKRRNFGWGMFIGFSPVSQIGYFFNDSTEQIFGQDTIAVQQTYSGDGGLNKVTWGNGFRLGRNVSIGVNAHYVFGTSNRNRSLYMPINDGFLSSRIQEKTRVQSFSFDFGAQYHGVFPVKVRIRPGASNRDSIPRSSWPVEYRRYTFVVGATYTLGNTIQADFDELGIQYVAAAIDVGLDTFLLSPTSKGAIRMPHLFGGGFALSNTGIWTVTADFNYGLWSQFSYFDQFNTKYSDSYSVHAGVQYTPRIRSNNNKNRFFKNIIYRAGARYNSAYFRPDGNPVDEAGFSFGLGLPFAFKKVYDEELNSQEVISYLNFGFEGGINQSRNNGVINETFFRFNVGITLRDSWFQKRRFN